MTAAIVRCPRCGRTVGASDDRYNRHGDHGVEYCPMSKQRLPVTGTSDRDYELRARLIADLAAQVQDRDPSVVWDYLTALTAAELQRLLVVALAAVPVDQTVAQMFSWVTDLPAAKAVPAC